jgi:hypothetical protein
MSENASIGFETWDLDTRNPFVCEFIKFFHSVENDSDLFTKIVSLEFYERQTKNF